MGGDGEGDGGGGGGEWGGAAGREEREWGGERGGRRHGGGVGETTTDRDGEMENQDRSDSQIETVTPRVGPTSQRKRKLDARRPQLLIQRTQNSCAKKEKNTRVTYSNSLYISFQGVDSCPCIAVNERGLRYRYPTRVWSWRTETRPGTPRSLALCILRPCRRRRLLI